MDREEYLCTDCSTEFEIASYPDVIPQWCPFCGSELMSDLSDSDDDVDYDE